jgi:hypothetical protein
MTLNLGEMKKVKSLMNLIKRDAQKSVKLTRFQIIPSISL